VLDDVDLDRAVSAGAWGSFLHQGQICMTTGRHLVHEAIYDDYVGRLAAKAGHLPVGNPATEQVALGPRFGGAANLDAFTDTRWVTIRGDIAPYPF
jgi:benzaldehyde dehydrogenase (NAD)